MDKNSIGMRIEDREIAENSPVFIVAELSANHNQNFDLAVKTIKAMKKSGADAVKLQTYTPDTITIDCDNDYFKIKKGLWKGKTLYGLYKEAYTPWEWQPKLKKIAENLGLICFSSVFDKTAADFLEKMNVSAYKVASFEIADIPLIEYIASKNKPILMSTGIATLSNLEEAVNACRRMGNEQIALLKCASAYPAPIEGANLLAIPNMKETFGTIVGLSDHTLGCSVAIASVALGAKIVEKHFILNRRLGGLDSAFSMEPEEFKRMVKSIREVEKALGTVTYKSTEEQEKSKMFSRSLFIARDIKKGEMFTKENVRSIRPGYGLEPKFIDLIIGKRAKKDLAKGTPVGLSIDCGGEEDD